jgi:hypothetical protein
VHFHTRHSGSGCTPTVLPPRSRVQESNKRAFDKVQEQARETSWPPESDANVYGSASTRHRVTRDKRSGTLTAMAAAVCFLLASCGGEATLVGPAAGQSATVVPATMAPMATPATPMAATPQASPVGTIVWTTAVDPRTSAPVGSVASFSPDADRIVAAAPVRHLPAGAALSASWTYNETSLDQFDTRLDFAAAAEDTWASFLIERTGESLWPAGTYEITIVLGGKDVQKAAVEVIAVE